MTTGARSRQYDGSAAVRPASDDSVPLREHLEKLIEDLRSHFDAALAAQIKRLDDLRITDKVALDAAFASRREALEAALKDQNERTRVALQANEKRLDALNELRKDVAMSVEVKAVDTKVERVDKDFNKLEARLDGRAGGLKDYLGWILAAIAVAGFVVAMLADRR